MNYLYPYVKYVNSEYIFLNFRSDSDCSNREVRGKKSPRWYHIRLPIKSPEFNFDVSKKLIIYFLKENWRNISVTSIMLSCLVKLLLVTTYIISVIFIIINTKYFNYLFATMQSGESQMQKKIDNQESNLGLFY